MRTRIATVLSAVMLILSAFSLAQPAAAVTEDYNLWVPLADDFDSCGSESERVFVTGTQHIVQRVTEDANGVLHISFTRHTQGTGIGTVSGDDYLLIDSVVRSQLTVDPGEFGQVFTEGVQALFIHKGEDGSKDDSVVHIFTHTTVSPDGDITSTVEIKSAVCR
jgi:hypothetical protein